LQLVASSSRPVFGRREANAATAVVAGCLAVAALAHFGVEPRGVVAAFFVSILAVLSRIDFERHILPNRIVLPAAAAVLVTQIAFFPDRALEWTIASLGAALFLFLPLLVYPSGMGMGDVKLALLLGAALGQAVVTALVLGFLFVVPVALFLLVRGGAAARKTAIPFGPFLAAGSVVALFLS
jgi:leader peptidase (prepilin peptidase) / N-methyltransferase